MSKFYNLCVKMEKYDYQFTHVNMEYFEPKEKYTVSAFIGLLISCSFIFIIGQVIKMWNLIKKVDMVIAKK